MRCIAYHNSHSGYHILYDVIMRSPVLSRAHLYCLHYIMAQRVGRPLTEVDMKTIGMPMKDTAELMGACRQTLYNKIQVSGNPLYQLDPHSEY